jgi:ubiquitin-like protein Pup
MAAVKDCRINSGPHVPAFEIAWGVVMSRENHDEREDIEPVESVKQREEQLAPDVDDILAKIDEVWEENAEEFVRSYVQKGGQGGSFQLTIETFAVMAAQGMAQGLAYDGFKRVIDSVIKRFRRQSGLDIPSPLEDDEYYDPHTAAEVESAYRIAEVIAQSKPDLRHTDIEAAAFQSAVIALEIRSQLGLISIGPMRYKRLARMARRREFEPSDLAKQIIDEWLNRHEM